MRKGEFATLAGAITLASMSTPPAFAESSPALRTTIAELSRTATPDTATATYAVTLHPAGGPARAAVLRLRTTTGNTWALRPPACRPAERGPGLICPLGDLAHPTTMRVGVSAPALHDVPTSVTVVAVAEATNTGPKSVAALASKVPPRPTQAETPAHAGEPAHVGRPARPGPSAHEGRPAQAGVPANVGRPAGPGSPAHVGRPVKPGTPAQAGAPAWPGMTASPGVPAGPGAPGLGAPARPGPSASPGVPGRPGMPVPTAEPGRPGAPGGSGRAGLPGQAGVTVPPGMPANPQVPAPVVPAVPVLPPAPQLATPPVVPQGQEPRLAGAAEQGLVPSDPHMWMSAVGLLLGAEALLLWIWTVFFLRRRLAPVRRR